jgi:uncharacterized protein YecE (DUF72 family)
VKLTPELEVAMADATIEAVAPLEEAGKLGALLLQLTPGFSPRKHELDELAPLIERFAPRPVALELRNRNWVRDERADETFAWLSEHDAAFVAVDAPPGEEFSIMPAIDAVTRDDLAYLRAHGRNTEGYLKGKTVAERFGWEYSDEELEEIKRRAQKMAEDAVSVHVAFNNNRGRDAPTSARRFRQLLGQDPGPPSEEAQLRIG